jgi:hypothetical protein
MTNLTRPRGHTPRRPNAQRFSDAVVASYIHDISERQHHPWTASGQDSSELRRRAHGRRGRSTATPVIGQLRG